MQLFFPRALLLPQRFSFLLPTAAPQSESILWIKGRTRSRSTTIFRNTRPHTDRCRFSSGVHRGGRHIREIFFIFTRVFWSARRNFRTRWAVVLSPLFLLSRRKKAMFPRIFPQT